MSHLPASSSKGVAVLTAQLDFRTEQMPAISVKNISHCAAGRHRTISEGKVGGEPELAPPSKGGRAGGRAVVTAAAQGCCDQHGLYCRNAAAEARGPPLSSGSPLLARRTVSIADHWLEGRPNARMGPE